MSVTPKQSHSNEIAVSVVEIEDRNGGSMDKALGSVMSFHDITYTVKVRKMCCGSCRQAKKKKILKNISGIMKPGLNAIMGATGSGKSSLLDVLARRKDPRKLKGLVLLDGKHTPKNFNYISGYVVQNDLLLGTITVTESLWFCANLRLPSTMSRKEKKKRINAVIKELKLESCADTKIGNQIIRGVSGGERKRTSIALELMLQPKILFLDEPTTGLDAATAISVMKLLKILGDKGNTIVFSIHQPRYTIFKLFDSLTLLSQGRLVYHGACFKALSHFEKIGYSCEAHDNPADFFLDVLSGSSAEDDQNEVDEITDKLTTAYSEGEEFTNLKIELEKMANSATKPKKTKAQMYATSFPHQLGVLLKRAAKNAVRDPQGLVGNVAINIIFGFIFGLIYFQVDNSPDAGIQNRLGVIFFLCSNLLFGSISAIDTFKVEREIFIREHVSGYYRIISYYLAKVLADLIPQRTIAPIIFCAIAYWMVGLKPTAGAFFIFVFGATLTGYAAIGIGLLYSTTFSNTVAQLLLIVTFVFTIVFSGLLVNVGTVLPWLAWLQYLSVVRYGLVALSINELRGRNFTSCGESLSSAQSSLVGASSAFTITRPDNETVCLSVQGDAYLYSSLSIGSSSTEITDWDLWQNFVALLCIVAGLYVLTYFQLMRTKTYS